MSLGPGRCLLALLLVSFLLVSSLLVAILALALGILLGRHCVLSLLQSRGERDIMISIALQLAIAELAQWPW